MAGNTSPRAITPLFQLQAPQPTQTPQPQVSQLCIIEDTFFTTNREIAYKPGTKEKIRRLAGEHAVAVVDVRAKSTRGRRPFSFTWTFPLGDLNYISKLRGHRKTAREIEARKEQLKEARQERLRQEVASQRISEIDVEIAVARNQTLQFEYERRTAVHTDQRVLDSAARASEALQRSRSVRFAARGSTGTPSVNEAMSSVSINEAAPAEGDMAVDGVEQPSYRQTHHDQPAGFGGEIECSVCFRGWETVHTEGSKAVRLNPCEHLFCEECVRRVINGGSTAEEIVCPLCTQVFESYYEVGRE